MLSFGRNVSGLDFPPLMWRKFGYGKNKFGAKRNAKNKYGARRTADGFPSQLERAVYHKLLDRQTLGGIRNIKRQQTVVLQDGPRDVRITWRVDFMFEEKIGHDIWHTVYAEAKGFPTKDYNLKLKMWRKNPPAPLEIWGGSARYAHMVERIE